MQKGTMRWDDLRVFLAVARRGRLQAAGRTLGLDPTTAGRRIAALEAGARDAALRAIARGLCADRGRARASRPCPGDGDARRARRPRSAAAEPERLSGTVRIGAPDGVSNYLLVDACDALSRDNPELQVQVVALPRIFSLSKREADLTITVSPPAAGRLTVRKIADYRLRLYARADLVAALGPVRTMADLRGIRGIGYISDMIFDQRARLLRAARARERAGADLEQPDHAAALVPARAPASACCRTSSPASIPSSAGSCPRTCG